MSQTHTPIDVICVCSSDGQIRPLRLRLEDEDHQLRRVDIDEIVSTRSIQYVGAEAKIYLCKASLSGREVLFEIKYSIRSHSWCLNRKWQ